MEDRRPPALIVLFLFAAGVLVLSAALLPLLWKGGHAFAGMVESFKMQETPVIGWLGEKLGDSPVPRYFNRAVLIAALILLWPLQKALRLRREDFALQRNPLKIVDLVIGFVVAVAMLSMLDIALLQSKLLAPDKKAVWEDAATKAVSAAFVVAILEEFLFRGAFHGAVRRTMPNWVALFGVSFLFAVVHFFKLRGPDEAAINTQVQAAGVSWFTGFEVLQRMLANFADPLVLSEEFATLFALGLLLGWARIRTNSLWLPIGLHAGFVFALKVFGGMTRATKALKTDQHLPWVGHDAKTGVVTGLAPLAALLVTAILLKGYFGIRRSKLAGSE